MGGVRNATKERDRSAHTCAKIRFDSGALPFQDLGRSLLDSDAYFSGKRCGMIIMSRRWWRMLPLLIPFQYCLNNIETV